MQRRDFLWVSLAGAGALATLGHATPQPARQASGTDLFQFVGARRFEFDLQSRSVKGVDALSSTLLKDLNRPVAVAGLNDRLYVLDKGDHQVVIFNESGQRVGQSTVDMCSPSDMVQLGDRLFVTDTLNHRVLELDASGALRGTLTAGFNAPRGIAVDGSGLLHVVDSGNRRVVTFTSAGKKGPTYALSAAWQPKSIVIDAQGFRHIADPTTRTVHVFDARNRASAVRSLPHAPVHLALSPGDQVYAGLLA